MASPASSAMPSASTRSPWPHHGILLLDKPVGVTSFQALHPVKHAFRGSKIGHAGTLDPAASGLLVLGIGAGTRLLEFLEALPKRYRFTARLGVVTDTRDLEGEVLERHDASAVTRERIESLLDSFRGEISQLPPAYSAIKIGGKRACDRARAGETVSMEPRRVRIDRIDVTGFEPGAATLEMECSKGTYVRSVAHELGRLLGCGAAADGIRRLAVGPFRVEDAVVPGDVASDALLPLDRAVEQLPAVQLKTPWIAPLRHGNPVPPAGYSARASLRGPAPSPVPSASGPAETPPDAEARPYAIFSPDDTLLAIGTINPQGELQPRKVLTGG